MCSRDTPRTRKRKKMFSVRRETRLVSRDQHHLSAKVEHVDLATGQCTIAWLLAPPSDPGGVTSLRLQRPSNTPTCDYSLRSTNTQASFARTHESHTTNAKPHRTAEIRSNALREGGPKSVIFAFTEHTAEARPESTRGRKEEAPAGVACFRKPDFPEELCKTKKPITGRQPGKYTQHAERVSTPWFSLMSSCLHAQRSSFGDFACLRDYVVWISCDIRYFFVSFYYNNR